MWDTNHLGFLNVGIYGGHQAVWVMRHDKLVKLLHFTRVSFGFMVETRLQDGGLYFVVICLVIDGSFCGDVMG